MKKKFAAKKPTQAELFSMSETTIITKKMLVTFRTRRPKRPRIDQELRDENVRLDEQRYKRKIRDLEDATEALKKELEELKKKRKKLKETSTPLYNNNKNLNYVKN